jgi:hypothetical protein
LHIDDLESALPFGDREVDDELADSQLVPDERGAWLVASRPRSLLVAEPLTGRAQRVDVGGRACSNSANSAI